MAEDKGKRSKRPSKKPKRLDLSAKALAQWSDRSPFITYDPVNTYKDPARGSFIDSRGVPLTEKGSDSDRESIWDIGSKAYRLLEITSEKDLASRYEEYSEAILIWRILLREAVTSGIIVDSVGRPYDETGLNFDEYTDPEVLSVAWEMIHKFPAHISNEYEKEFKAEHFLISCLRKVDNTIVGIWAHGEGAVSSAIEAADTLANAEAIIAGNDASRQARRKLAYHGAIERHRKDPKQAEKNFVFECYQDWQADPTRYKSKAQFARDMLDKCTHLVSQKKIEDWVRQWNKRY